MGYSVSGNRLLHDGQEIQIFGVNVCGAELNDGTISGLWSGQTIAEMVARIKAQGFNAVRLPIGPKCIQNVVVNPDLTAANWLPGNSYLKGKRSLEILDYWLAEFEKQGLRYFFDWHYLENGKIPDLWWTQAYSEQQWLTDLKFIAQRYRGRAGLIGIDIKNEPNNNTCTWGDGNTLRDWKLAAEKAYQAINSVNQDIITIVEWTGTETGIGQMVNNPLNIPANKLALSPHIYFSDVWGQYVKYFDDPNYPNNLPAVWDKMLAFSPSRLIIVGEWGGKFGKGGKTKDKTDQEAFARYLRDRGIINFTYWQWGENSGDTGGILADGTWKNVRADKVQMLYTVKTSKATYLGEGAIPSPTPEIPVNPRPTDPVPTPTPTPTPVPSNPLPATPVNVTFPSKMSIDNFPAVQKVSLDRDIVVNVPPADFPDAISINNLPAVQRVEVMNPAQVTMPSAMSINNFPTTQRVIVENPTDSAIPDNINVNLTGQTPNINNFIIPDVLKVLLEGAASGGGGSTNVPSEFTIKQTLTHAFPSALPQLTVNVRNVAPAIVAPSASLKAFRTGSLVSMLAAPTIKMVVERYEGDLAVCRFSNDMNGEFSTASFPDALLVAWAGT